MKKIIFSFLLSFIITTSFAQTIDSIFNSVKYRNIGPFRGGRSVAASGVIGDPMTYYMGNTGGGLWKTEDGGQLWKNISDGYFKTSSIGAVAVSESDPNIIYVGMGEHAPRAVMTSYGDGVYKSTDAGKTWKNIGLKNTQHISRVVIHPKNPNIVFVAAQGALYGPNKERGIFKSVDGGVTWNKILYVNNFVVTYSVTENGKTTSKEESFNGTQEEVDNAVNIFLDENVDVPPPPKTPKIPSTPENS